MSSSRSSVRIGTWNLDGQHSARHEEFLQSLRCRAVLLQEVPAQRSWRHHQMSTDAVRNSVGNHWAAVATDLDAAPEDARCPAEGSWSVRLDGLTLVSSVLPYRSSPRSWSSLEGADQGERTARLLAKLATCLQQPQVVWGGDWNHTLTGPDHSGCQSGRGLIEALLLRSHLQVPGLGLAQHERVARADVPPERTIDHVAVPMTWCVLSVERHVAQVGAERLSDHDAYVVEALCD